MADTLMLLDSASLYFRAFYGVPETVVAPDGTPVNAVRGLLDMISMLVGKYHPQRLVACMDADWRPSFRVAAVPSYKAHRVAPAGGEEVPDTLGPQVPVLQAVLAAVGIAQLGVAGHEADDVIGTLATVHDGPVDIVTGDRDLFQLVRDDQPVRVLYTAKGMRDLPAIDEAEVSRRYGIPGRSYADFALLRGDPSDGLPGVPGVGDKTAAGIISRYGSVAALLEALDQPPEPGLSPSVRAKLVGARDYLVAARPVVDVVRDLPVPAGLDDLLPTQAADPDALVTLSERWGLDSPLNRLLTVLGST
ncbi:5'-3' exonuclease [Acidothermaceae bacterium B102]|nr:5'-3' exonuclease [Acidothermaceae bacterium B102]